ncbi:MAG: Hsp20/alpha crystallin family protein [Phycisphaeraceae bacterium]|nr:MAG: Hsp20/alpha crystallin family protein [Phycisphaeraceae bacterium]
MLTIRTQPGRTSSGAGQFRSEMDRLFNTFFQGAPMFETASAPTPRRLFPALNAWETPESLMIEAELPGFRMEDLDISLLGDELTIRGVRTETQTEGLNFRRRERISGEFARTVTLPVEVDPDRVSASLRDGVLTIELPKAASARPRKIQVRTA